MLSTWRDPDDITPGARRTPREITGFRSYDPLRKLMMHPNSNVSVAHVMAADKLREAVDIAALGYSGERPLIYVAHQPQPRWGMSKPDIARTAADRIVRRVLRIFPATQIHMIEVVILRNVTVAVWARAHKTNQQIEMGRLLSILDRLVQYFESEIDDDLATGRRLPP